MVYFKSHVLYKKMKTGKFFTSLLLFFIGLVLIGELQYVCIDDSASSCFYTVYFSNIDNYCEFSTEINDLVQASNCIAFVKEYNSRDYISNYDIYYCSTRSEKIIMNKLNLNETQFENILSGRCTFKLESLENYIGKNNNGSGSVLFVYGYNSDNLSSLIYNLKQNYSVERIDEPTQYSKFSLIINIAWVIIIIINSIITIYEILLNRKNVAIKVLYGKKILWIVTESILIDFLIFGLIFVVEGIVLSEITAIDNAKREIFLKFIVFIVANSLIHVVSVFFDFIKSLKNYIVNDNIIAFNYFFMTISGFLVLVLPLINLHFVNENKDYISLHKTMSNFNQYCYVETNMSITNEDSFETIINSRNDYVNTAQKLYSYFYTEYDAVILSHESEHNIVYANRNSYNYLSEFIPNLKDNNKAAIITPNSYMVKNLNYAKRQLKQKGIDYSVIESTSLLSLPCFNSEEINKFKLVQNPIIIYNPYAPRRNDVYDCFLCNISKDVLYSELKSLDISDENIAITNVYDNFVHYWRPVYLVWIICLVTLIVVVVFDLILFVSFINLQFKLKYKEFSIRYILGNGIIDRYDTLYLTIVITNLLGFLMAFLVNLFLFDDIAAKISVINVFLKLAFDIIYLRIKIYRFEKISFQKLLKGGYI